MLKDIVRVKPLTGHQLWIQFEDRVEGVIDVADLVSFSGVFAQLNEESFFRRVRVNAEIGTICWPNGADLDPDVLYSAITGEPIRIREVA